MTYWRKHYGALDEDFSPCDVGYFHQDEYKPIEISEYHKVESYIELIVDMLRGEDEYDEKSLLSYFRSIVEDLEMNIDLRDFKEIKMKYKEEKIA